MPKTDLTIDAERVLGDFVERAGKTFLVVRRCDVSGDARAVRVTPDDVADFYAAQARDSASGCRTLAGRTGDWRAVSASSKAALDWFGSVNLIGMRRAACRRGLVPRF